MKNLLILTTANLGSKNNRELFVDYLKRHLKGVANVFMASFSDLVFDIKSGDVKVNFDGYEISDFDLVYFRVVKRSFSLARSLAVCLEDKNIPFIDSVFRYTSYAGNKLTSQVRLAVNDLPTIPTFFCSPSKIIENADKIIAKFGLPVVGKDLVTHRGSGVFLLKNKEDFLTLAESSYGGCLFQKFCEKDHEYRLLVLNDKVAVAEKKVQKDINEFRSNVALGAYEEFIEVDKVTDELKEVAVKAAKALCLEIAGVDILVDTNGKAWLTEVNRGPGFTYSEISPELPRVAEFFKKELVG
jgi:RimK family alpha-L-glutamate ligase